MGGVKEGTVGKLLETLRQGAGQSLRRRLFRPGRYQQKWDVVIGVGRRPDSIGHWVANWGPEESPPEPRVRAKYPERETCLCSHGTLLTMTPHTLPSTPKDGEMERKG